MPQRIWAVANGSLTRGWLWFALAACLLVGCGRERVVHTVTGKVTYQGAPVAEGTIMFLDSTTQDANQAELGPRGTYTLQVPPGSYRVAIQPILKQIGGEDGPPDYVLQGADDIPEKYQQPETTDFRAEIKANATLDFDMLAPAKE